MRNALDIFVERVYNRAQYEVVCSSAPSGLPGEGVCGKGGAAGAIREKNEVKKWHKVSLAAFIPMT